MRRLGPRQAALYAAEAESLGGLGVSWRRLAEARAYLDTLVESDWFAARWPHFVRCALQRRGRGSRWSTCQPLDADGPGGRPTEGVVLVADGGLSQPVLLHELSHLLAAPGSGHGDEFAAVQLALVRREMGFFAYAAYRQALRRTPAFRAVDAAPLTAAG